MSPPRRLARWPEAQFWRRFQGETIYGQFNPLTHSHVSTSGSASRLLGSGLRVPVEESRHLSANDNCRNATPLGQSGAQNLSRSNTGEQTYPPDKRVSTAGKTSSVPSGQSARLEFTVFGWRDENHSILANDMRPAAIHWPPLQWSQRPRRASQRFSPRSNRRPAAFLGTSWA